MLLINQNMFVLQALKLNANRVCIYSKNSALKYNNNNNSRIFIRFGARSLSDERNQKLSAYVSHPYSYAYGRSNSELQYTTIGDLLSSRTETDKTRTALISAHENITKTYDQFNNDVNSLATGLYTKLGLRRGDVVGLWCCNSYSWIQIQYACAKLGVILCTINPVYREQELNYTLRKANIKTLFIPGIDSKQEVANKFQQIFAKTMKLNSEADIDLVLSQLVILDGQMPTEINRELEVFPFQSLISDDISPLEMDEHPSPDDPAIILFTSGTTGKPKGALLSQFTLVNNAILNSKSFGIQAGENTRICLPLPLFHTFGAILGSLAIAAMPASIVLTGFRYNTKAIVDSLKAHDCTHMFGTPTMIIDAVNYAEKNEIKLPSLRGVFIGSAPVPIELTNRIRRIIPSVEDIRIRYGATELGPTATVSHKSDPFESRVQTVGSPLDFVSVKIVDTKTGIIKKIGEHGEILIRGHNVMIGYWKDPVKTKETINEAQWYKSGDLGVMDENGFVRIIGRIKELIIRGGENIYPREIEELLHTHPDIHDAYIIGVPDERLGEQVCAWIKLKGGKELTAESIKEFCKDKISYFKIPKYVMFVEEFPLTPSGKPQKYIMREKSCEILGLKEL